MHKEFSLPAPTKRFRGSTHTASVAEINGLSPFERGVDDRQWGAMLNGQARWGFPPFCRRLGAGGHPLAFTTKRRRPLMNCLLKGGRGGQVYQDVASSYTVCVSVPCCPQAVGGNVLEGEILYALAFPPSWSVCRSPEAETAVVSFFPPSPETSGITT